MDSGTKTLERSTPSPQTITHDMAQLDPTSAPLTEQKTSSSVVKPIEMATPSMTSPSQTPRTISELISLRAKQSPNHKILGYPREGIEYVEYTYGQIDGFVNAGARHLAARLPVRPDSSATESVVAILGSSSLDYFITVLALSRLGFTVLFLSTRLSEAAYVSLLSATGCSHVCIDPSFRKIMTAVEAKTSRLHIINILSGDNFDLPDDDAEQNGQQAHQHLEAKEENQKVSWIIHSSGSTGLPKPIYLTHAAALRNYENNMNMEGFITLPLFHAHGISSVLRGFTSRKKIFMYNASQPLTSSNLLGIMRKYPFEIFYGVPYALKLLSETDEGVQMLTRMKVVMFGGSACPDGLGDLLVDHGVNLISHYGTTETGQLMTSFRPPGDKAWNYVRVHTALEPFASFEPRGANLYELVILGGWPSKVATNRDDGAYATKDLFEPHTAIKGAWKYAGRLDDTIVLMNGEKAIPIAMEMAIRQQALVKDVVVFGTGRARLGIFIVASDSAAAIKTDTIIGGLWPFVEEENKNSAAYAQISQEMIKILPAGTPYPQTDKGTLIRQAFYKMFANEIEKIYQKVETATGGTLVLDEAEQREWLREQIVALCPGLTLQDVQDDTDLFFLGVDSLQSSRVRQTILQTIELNGNEVSQNIVFENPSVAQLASAIIAAQTGADKNIRDVEEEMAELIAKYGHFPQHIPVQRQSDRKIVAVTGATGSLGAHVVAQLVLREDVTEVCCLVRASSNENALTRVFKSMTERAVLHSLPLHLRRKIIAYASDFGKTDLGLNAEAYAYLQSGLISIIHCAWSVNFNKHLSSFEADCIAGTRNLMLLCLSARALQPASFNFCSSVSTVARYSGSIIPESLPETLKSAQAMGYAQSKLVTEHIVAKAAEQTGMTARVLRVGQIVADTAHGIWNNTEAIPLMLQSAKTIGALPSLDETPRWLPVDIVAQTVNEISLSNSTSSFFNIVNLNTFHWSRDLLPYLERAGLAFERVGQREWVRRLRDSNSDVVTNPTFKLLEFFASKYDRDREVKAALPYETKAVEAVCPSLRECPALTQELVDKFVKTFFQTSWATNVPAPDD